MSSVDCAVRTRIRYTVFSILASLGAAWSAAPAVAQCSTNWIPGVPAARYSHAMAFDSARGRVVLFGGTKDSVRDGETWEWDGTTWSLRSTTGPTPREGHAMAYDPIRNRTILFGGFDGAASDQTWEWNGTSWTIRVVTGPSARYNHAMVFDASRGGIILYGGFTGSALQNDTWLWNGTDWTQLTVTGPSARQSLALAYDSARQRVVLTGGDEAAGIDNETWELTPSNWTLRSTGDPLPLSRHVMVFDTSRNRTLLFGGYAGTYQGETWEWDGTSWSLRSTGGPTPRYALGMAYDSTRNRAVLFGGLDSLGGTNDTWEWNGSGWTLRAAGGPSPRYWHAMVYDTQRNRLVLFGGSDVNGTSGETWEAENLVWTRRVVAGPAPRYWHSMAYDSARGVTVLFGGRDSARYGDTWEWNGTSWTQRAATGPSAREGAAMCYDAARGVCVLFGGFDGARRDDTWEWNGTSWTQRSPATRPSARYWHAMTYDSTRGRCLMFGGLDPDGLDNETWEFTGTNWIQVAVTGPTGRTGHAMAYDAVRGRAILFGGYTGIAANDTWEWNGSTASWLQRPPGPPAARQRHAAAFDASRSTVVIFGGTRTGSGYYGDTWEYVTTGGATITQQPQSASVCSGQPAQFSVVASGSGLTYQWRRNSVNIPGANASTYSIPSATPAHAGNYDVVVTNACGSVNSAIAVLTVSTGPTITQQPQSQTVCAGQPAVFTVAASGSGLTYQWRRNTVNIPGATSATYSIASAAPGDAANYDCVVGSTCGSTTSDAALLTVNGAPAITQQPQNAAVCTGEPASFTVVASGAGLTYQWRRNAANIPGANSATYNIAAAGPGDVGAYDVIVSGTCGQTTSNTATLTLITSGPVITQQPQSISRCVGDPASFTVVASGSGLTYQWRRNTVNIPGATAATYTIAAVSQGDAASYDVIVTSNCGSTTSNAATLTVVPTAVITQQPQSIQVCTGAPASFTVAASGSNLFYQWRRNGVAISGATNPTYSIPSVSPADVGNYDVVVDSDCNSVTSDVATLTIGGGGPSITQQPQNQASCSGGTATFTVVANGSPPLTYQWRRDTVNIPNANAATLVLNNVTPADAGSYDVIVTDACGSVTSSAATLTLGLRGDTNCNGVINNFDIDPFVIALVLGQEAWQALFTCDFICANDINGDGLVNNFDVDPFVQLLLGGG